MIDYTKKVVGPIAAGVSLLWTGMVSAEYKYNFPEPVTPIGQSIYDVHMLTMSITTVILVIITLIVLYAVFTFRKDKGYVADQEFHNSWFGRWSWVIVPVAVLAIDLSIAGKAQPILEMLWESPTKECSDPTLKPENKDKCYDMIVKITGHQWWWDYEYPDLGIKIESRYIPEEESGDNYLRAPIMPTGSPNSDLRKTPLPVTSVKHGVKSPKKEFTEVSVLNYVVPGMQECLQL